MPALLVSSSQMSLTLRSHWSPSRIQVLHGTVGESHFFFLYCGQHFLVLNVEYLDLPGSASPATAP